MSTKTDQQPDNFAEAKQGRGGDCPRTTCSPSLTPETDALRELYENHEHRANVEDIWDLCESLERERNAQLATMKIMREVFPRTRGHHFLVTDGK